GHPLDTVRPALPLEHGVGALALDPEYDVLEAAALVRAGGDRLPLVAEPFGVLRQHPEDVVGPKRSLVATDTRADLDDDILAVCWIGLDERELRLLLELAQLRSQLGDELLQVAVLARRG